MKLYYAEIWVGNYCISAVAETPEKCQDAIVKAYHKDFGSFRSNGFKSKAEWLEWHDIEKPCGFLEIELNKGWVR